MKPTAGDYEEKLFQLNTKTTVLTHTQCLHPVTRHQWIGLRIAMCPGGTISRSFHVSFFPSLMERPLIKKDICYAYDMCLIL
jgi:hypothetical protein